jgi:hypothetical protein
MIENRSRVAIGKVVADSVEELDLLFDRHKRLLSAALADGVEVHQDKCVSLRCPCRQLLRETVLETIMALDETRKSFKSKQLAVLRLKLVQLLAEQG